jgi:biopolymer transport protein ExbB
MWPLLASSIAAVAIGVERFMVFRRASIDVAILRSKLEKPLMESNWTMAEQAVEELEAFVAAIAATGVRQASQGLKAAETAMETAANRGAAKLRKRLDFLGLMVTLAPLLGLLGTVLGMIRAFNVLTIKSGQPMAITGGVGEALIATATGLCVAILALCILTYFRSWLDSLLGDAEEVAALILSAVAERER